MAQTAGTMAISGFQEGGMASDLRNSIGMPKAYALRRDLGYTISLDRDVARAEPDSETGEPPAKPDIFRYESHRDFLRDQYLWLQGRNPKLSHRMLAKAAGFANPGFFNDVVKGRRKTNSIGLERYGRALSLGQDELEFLQCLMVFSEADSAENVEIAREMLERRRNRKGFKRLKQDQTRYYLDFNYMLVRAAIEALDFRGDYKQLGEFIHPPMTAEVVKPYVRDLCEWGLVVQRENGRYMVTHAYQEPPKGVRELTAKMHKALLSQSSNLLGTVPPDRMHVSTAMVTVSGPVYKAILKSVRRFRDELLELVKNDKDPDRVASISIQCLPRSRWDRTPKRFLESAAR